jgi:hypothetical protein
MTREADTVDSGLAWLTGRRSGPPLIAPGRAASVARELGRRFGVDGAALLTERAALQGLSRNAPWSPSGTAGRSAARTAGWPCP